MFRLVRRNGSEAMGARVGIEAAGRVQWRHVARADSYLSSHDPRAHFGLGEAEHVD